MQKFLNTLKLLLPAVIPSWRFFDFIEPSPRVQYTLLPSVEARPDVWKEFRPRPQSVSIFTMLGRMLWNPVWNESLFLVSCAERLIDYPTRHSEDEILQRIAMHLIQHMDNTELSSACFLQFRLVFVKRSEDRLEESVLFHSRISPLVLSPGSAEIA
ncbi:MAG: hypothetical protein OEX19_05300 [Gammaproteobacteria bacterium]|nr:hypothetical protein [Gammaproteobacteria bacterium]